MENNKQETYDDDLSLYVRKIVKPIFNKVANETPSNRVSVGGGRSVRKSMALYQPHFYRLYFDFSKKNFNPEPLKIPTFEGSVDVTYKSKNHNSEHEYRNFMGCRITVKKKQVEVQNYIEHKRVYPIGITENAESQVRDIIRKKDIECMTALKKFIEIYGGESDLKILKRRAENKVWGTNAINSIPPKTTFHNPVVKKVYMERNVEYFDPIHTVNHLVNSGVIEVVPSICESIESLAYNINPLRTIKNNIQKISDVFKLKDLIIKLSDEEKEDLSGWLFTLEGK